MSVLLKRSILGVLVFGVVAVGITGFGGEAGAQVFQGSAVVTSPVLVTLTMTITLHPGGPATYTFTGLQGQLVDRGFLVASVNGSSVTGYFQTAIPNIRPCFFSGTLNGSVATLTSDPESCGLMATVTLTRIA